VRGVPAWALKAGAVGLTVLAAYSAAAYVGGHLKNGGAPLRPSLHPQTGQVTLSQGVRATTSQPLTETYAS
jgi:hypothetical protein